MVKPVIVKRNTKGSALTFTELDTNFQNLDDATITLKGGSGGVDVVSDLNGTITLVATDGLTITGNNTAKTISLDTSVLQDTTPQLGGNLDVQTYKITTSVTNGNIEIDPPGSGKVIISGDLQVDGTTTTINSTTLDVDDKNITLAKGAANAAAADGGGITLEGPATAATLLYENTDDSWNFNKDLGVGNNDVQDVSGVKFNVVTEQDHTAGRAYWDPVDGTLAIGMEYDEVVQKVGLNTFFHIKNQSGVTISKGQAVMAVGTVGGSGQILGARAVADGSVNSRYMLGIANMNIANGEDGYVVHFGLIKGINTSAYADGTVLWLNPATAGGLTATEPSAGNIKIAIGYVINGASNGSIFVRANTGFNIQDLHDVEVTSPQDGDTLTYVASSGIWVNGPGGKSYNLSAESTSSGDAFISLNGSDATTDMVEIAAGTGIQVAKTDSSTITISRQVYTWDSLGALTWDDLG